MVKTNDLLWCFPPSSISVQGTTMLYHIIKALIIPLFSLLCFRINSFWCSLTLPWNVLSLCTTRCVSWPHLCSGPPSNQTAWVSHLTHPAIMADLLLFQHWSTMSLTCSKLTMSSHVLLKKDTPENVVPPTLTNISHGPSCIDSCAHIHTLLSPGDYLTGLWTCHTQPCLGVWLFKSCLSRCNWRLPSSTEVSMTI